MRFSRLGDVLDLVDQRQRILLVAGDGEAKPDRALIGAAQTKLGRVARDLTGHDAPSGLRVEPMVRRLDEDGHLLTDELLRRAARDEAQGLVDDAHPV